MYHRILPRFQAIKIEALSIEEKIMFRVESHIFAGESLKESEVVKIPKTTADLYLRIFEAILGTLIKK